MESMNSIKPNKNTSFAILLEAQRRGWENYFLESHDVWLQDGIVWGRMNKIHVEDNLEHWFEFSNIVEEPLNEHLDVLFMRQEPPFTIDYIYLTYLLEQAESKGLLVVNKPLGLRNANEKFFTTWFPQCNPKTLVTSQAKLIVEFIHEEKEIVVKPLAAMGGSSVFRVSEGDPNTNVILEVMTQKGSQLVMAQRFIPEIAQGDKRIILIDGEPIPYALARIPAPGDFRGNMVAGANIEGRELTERDRWICEQVGPTLRENGLIFVGLDVIGNYLSEINVTSPTGVRQLDTFFDLNICADLLDWVENRSEY